MDYAAINAYLQELVPARPPVMAEMEAFAQRADFPIIGPASGQFCYLIARLTGARRIFELGSGFGYSTAWFARAVRENGGGIIDHVVWDDQLSQDARSYLDRLGYGDLVRYTVGEAIESLEQSEGEFDLIFNDIDKQAYPASLDVIARKLRKGGTLLVDNLLWHGRIFDPEDHSPATEGVRTLTHVIRTDPRWIVSIVPIRDGLLVAQRV